MKRMLLALIALVAGAAPVFAEAPPQRDLLFHASFDRMSVNADYASGKPGSIDFESDLELRPREGFNGKNAFLRQDHETLSYDAKGNFNPVQGALSVWVQPVNWEPAGEKLKPLGHKHFLSINFQNAKGHATLSLYKYYTQDDLVFLITTELNKSNWLVRVPGSIYKKGQWIKFDATWGDGRMTLYINGKEVGSNAYEHEYDDIAQAGVASGKIMVNPILWGGENESWDNKTTIDEVKIFDRVLSAAEVARNYMDESGNIVDLKETPPVRIVGLDRNDGRLDCMMADIDLNSLELPWIEAMQAGQVKVAGQLRRGDQTIYECHAQPRDPKWRVFLENASDAGEYEFILNLTNTATGDTRQIITPVSKPDLSFYGNENGKEDFVPAPWTPIKVDGDRVAVWNRTYQFDGPFIQQVTSGGHEVLDKGVTLLADTGDGPRPVIFGDPQVSQTHQDHVVFTGQGKLNDLTIRYTNTVWFDGFSRVQFEVGPAETTLKSLRLTYAVKPEYSKYHTMATWRSFEKGGNHYAFNHDAWRGFSQLWLMGDTHGFCWVPENEGNWVYPQGDKPIHLYKGDAPDAVARVVLDLIAQPVTIPENLTYSFGFIATPTRPLPEDFRTFATGGWNLENTTARSVGWGGRGFTSYASLIPLTAEMHLPGKTYDELLHDVWSRNGILSFPYSSPTGLSSDDDVVAFYKDCWEVPGSSAFPISDVHGKQYHQVYVTPTRIMRDFFAQKVENFLSRRDKEIGGVYYDLCFVMPIRNAYAPTCGAFTDAFGRKIPSQLNTIGLRECLMRTLKICRKYDKRAWYHGHVVYNPAVMGLGDFWYPGEHLATPLANNPYYYLDEMPISSYETEFNPHQKGVGVINLPVISRVYRERGDDPKPTESMLGMMMLNDIISSATQAHLPTIDKMWGIRKRYQLDKSNFIRFDRNSGFESSSPDVVSSFYQLKDGRLFAIIVNRSPEDRQATVRFAGRYASAEDPWRDQPLELAGTNALNLEIPARLFRIVVLTPAAPGS